MSGRKVVRWVNEKNKSFEWLVDEISVENAEEFIQSVKFRVQNRNCQSLKDFQMRILPLDKVKDQDTDIDTWNYLLNVDLYDVIEEDKYRELSREYLGKKIYVNLNRIEKIEKYMGICKDFKEGYKVKEVSEKWKISRDYARKIRGRYMDMWDKYCQKR